MSSGMWAPHLGLGLAASTWRGLFAGAAGAWQGNPFCFDAAGAGGVTFDRCCRSRGGNGSWQGAWARHRLPPGADEGPEVEGCWGAVYDPSLCCMDVEALVSHADCEAVGVPFEGFWAGVRRNLTRYLSGDKALWAGALQASSLFDYTQMPAFGACPLGAAAVRLFHLVNVMPELPNACPFVGELGLLKAVPWRLLVRTAWGPLLFSMLAALSDSICALHRGHKMYMRCEGEELEGVGWEEQVRRHAGLEEMEVDIGEGRREWLDHMHIWDYWVHDPGAPQDAWDQHLLLVLLSKAHAAEGPDAEERRDVLLHAAQQLIRRPWLKTLREVVATHRRFWQILYHVAEKAQATMPTDIMADPQHGMNRRTEEALPGLPRWLARPVLQNRFRGEQVASLGHPLGLPLDLARQWAHIDVLEMGTHRLCGVHGMPLVVEVGSQAMAKHFQVVILGASLRRWHAERSAAASTGPELSKPTDGWVVEVNLYLINQRSKDHCRHDPGDERFQFACEQDGCGHFLEFACAVADGADVSEWSSAVVHSSLNWIRPLSPNLLECALPAGFDPASKPTFTVLFREAQGLWKSDVKLPLCLTDPPPLEQKPPQVAICLRPLFRMDNPDAGWILRDWLRYHRLIGIDHFVFYDVDGTLGPWLREPSAAGLVSYFPFVYRDMPAIAQASERMLQEEGGLWGHEFLFDHCLFWLRALGAAWGLTLQAPDKYLVGPARGESLRAFLRRWQARPEVGLVYLRDRRFRGLAAWPSARAETPAMLRFPLYEEGLEPDGRKAPWVAAFRPSAVLHVQGHTARPRASAEDPVAGELEGTLRANHYLEVFGRAGHWREAGGVQATGNGSAFDEEVLWALPQMHCWRSADLRALAGGPLRPETPLLEGWGLRECGLGNFEASPMRRPSR